MSGIFVYTAVAGFLAGVAVRSIFAVPLVAAMLLGCAGLAGLLIRVFRRQKMHAFFALAFLFLLLFSLGIVRAHAVFSDIKNFLDAKTGHVVLEGTVVKEPSFSERSQQLVVEVREKKEDARVVVFTELFPEYRYGDVVAVSGFLKKPEPFETQTGRVFDYPQYLARDGIYYQMLFPKITLVSDGGGNALFRFLYGARRMFVASLKRFLPEPDAGLLAGISIGASEGLDEETQEMFRRAGLIHIVVLSGYNITVVADTIMRLLSFLPRVAMLSGGGVIVVLFVLATGASATAVRAGAMALLALAARMFGARYDIVRVLFLVALSMVAWNPRVLLFDPSFQLSFLATFGLVTLSPILERVFARIPNTFSLRQTLSATLATQMCVVPLLTYTSGSVSLISLIANVVVLPTVPLSMFFGSVLGVVGIFSYTLGIIASFPAVFIARFILTTSSVLSDVPLASVSVSEPLWVVWALYALLCAVVIRAHARTSRLPDSS